LPYFGKNPAIRPLRILLRRFLTVAILFLQFQLRGQGISSGCTSHFYKVNYGFSGDGVINLNSLTIGPDGCMYLGSDYGYIGYNSTFIDVQMLPDGKKNRWGQQVFASTIPLNGWDGNINGTLQPPGTYVWFCSYQLQGQQTQFQKGTLLLIR
jgi:hypothetical protein